ncbi:MAG: site-specific DNA-methyltransferase [Pseudomonadota bacterium]
MAAKKISYPIPVETVKHKDKRANIPTEELRDFVAEYETRPAKMLYPRDPSLDPQLVWKGKDEQDREDLSVPVVPIYIQEKIQPKAIIEDLRQVTQKGKPAQLNLFADFNGLEFEKLIDFYKYEQDWTNRMILGDSLLVMTSLAEKEGLKGKVQMIYLDPPYGIKFGSNWQVSTRKREVQDGKAEYLTRQPEQIRAFRDTWKLGIHSYLAYLRDRLVAARDLLTETGSIFVQIGDENVHLVRCLLDEVFGSENFISIITFRKTTGVQSNYIASVSDYLLWYAKSKETGKFRNLFRSKEGDENYRFIMLDDGSYRTMNADELSDPTRIPVGAKIFRFDHPDSPGLSASDQRLEFQGSIYLPPANRHWSSNIDGMRRLAKSNRLVVTGNTLSNIRYLNDFNVFPFNSFWDDTTVGGSSDRWYVVQTATKVIQRCLLMTTDPGDLVLDPTCGSGTTAYVAEQWGRRWITIDTSRVALALARTRLMAARYPYYLLADSPEGQRKEIEITGTVGAGFKPAPTANDIKKGFVYKRVPHVTLKSIANNPEIDAIHVKWQEKLEPIREQLNKLLNQSFEEWQLPREADKKWPPEAPKLLEQWWGYRCKRQEEIDAAILRHSDPEILYDQPYEDNKRIRVAGPFTVESLSPHRVLEATEDLPASEIQGQTQSSAGEFVSMILENLKKAGVQNTFKNERLTFDRLEPYAGVWLQATGGYTEKDGKSRRVAVCIGPEHGTVGPELIKEAAKEAVQGIGFGLLIVCGFAFDPHVSEEVKRYGKLTVLPARMNPDLTMGDELLKKTGAGNLFMVFGEPDVEIKKQKDGKLTVEIRGVDVYDPTTGQIRSNSTDDIACWFIDTDYNSESFFVRHAYFTSADEPYEKLKRALRAEINEEAWSSLYSTTSRPFDPPTTGKIAIKVINHYGDEVLKVFEV